MCAYRNNTTNANTISQRVRSSFSGRKSKRVSAQPFGQNKLISGISYNPRARYRTNQRHSHLCAKRWPHIEERLPVFIVNTQGREAQRDIHNKSCCSEPMTPLSNYRPVSISKHQGLLAAISSRSIGVNQKGGRPNHLGAR